mgnify:CR=1 FL=1
MKGFTAKKKDFTMKKFRFTIIELLLVISIAGVMISVAVPAFSRMLKGSASGIAVRELMGKLNAARAYAVANKTYVEYLLQDYTQPMGVATYRVMPEKLKKILPPEEDFKRLLDGKEIDESEI